MHTQKVFLHMIRTIELFLAKVTMKWFLVAVDILVPCEQVAAVGRVGTGATRVSLATLAAALGLRRARLPYHCTRHGASARTSLRARRLYLNKFKFTIKINLLTLLQKLTLLIYLILTLFFNR